MPRATKEELEWAYAVTREKFLERVNKMFPIKTDDWNRYLDGIFELISNDEAPLYESKMNAYLEETVVKYLHPSDDYVSLTKIARKYDAANPSYLIQSWLRSRNTVEFLATWERKHNSNFNEDAFQRMNNWIQSTFALTCLSTGGSNNSPEGSGNRRRIAGRIIETIVWRSIGLIFMPAMS